MDGMLVEEEEDDGGDDDDGMGGSVQDCPIFVL
jgi:hypothetical protein